MSSAPDEIRLFAKSAPSMTALKPAMQIYLYLSVMTSLLGRRHACHQLNLYLLVLDELRDRSSSAGLTLSMYRKALKLLSEEKTVSSQSPHRRFNSDSISDPLAKNGDEWLSSIRTEDWLTSGHNISSVPAPFENFRYDY